MRYQASIYDVANGGRELRSYVSESEQEWALKAAVRSVETYIAAGWSAECVELGVVRVTKGVEAREIVVEEKEA